MADLKTVQAGELNHRIQIFRTEITEDKDGYTATKQEVLALSCWAKVSRTSGTEIVRANAEFGEEKVRFLVRFPRVEINRKMFVRWQGREYPIQYINDYAGRKYLEIWTARQSKEAT